MLFVGTTAARNNSWTGWESKNSSLNQLLEHWCVNLFRAQRKSKAAARLVSPKEPSQYLGRARQQQHYPTILIRNRSGETSAARASSNTG